MPQRRFVRADRGSELVVEPELAQAMAMALHDLATNAVKYGALSTRAGRVKIEWSTLPGQKLYLRWIETGGPRVAPPTKEGFGTRAIQRLIGQLSGEVKFDWHAHGVACDILIDAAPASKAPAGRSRKPGATRKCVAVRTSGI